jgi:cytidylate kinase
MSKVITNCNIIYKSVYLEDCYFCSECANLKHCFACQGLKDQEYMIFNQQVTPTQFEAIKKLAEEESFVIVGRVADYVLRHKENKISIFICADVSDRVARVMEYENISDKKAEKLIAKADKNRAKYYNFFSHNKWGDAKTYDICINSSVLGIDKTADYLIDYIENVLRAKGLK